MLTVQRSCAIGRGLLFAFDHTMLLQRVYVGHLGAGIFCNTDMTSDSYFFDWTRFVAIVLWIALKYITPFLQTHCGLWQGHTMHDA
jgi:hypothetical protein